MIRIRRFEDKCAELLHAEKIRGFLHLYDGEEAVAVGVIPLLEPTDRRRRDLSRARPCTGARRAHGCHHGRDVRQGAKAAPAGAADLCTSSAARPISTAATRSSAADCRWRSGSALADRMRSEDRVTACFFGEGAVAEGEFHESMNLAKLWDLPVLFVCENNGYAMGTRARPVRGRDRHPRQGDELWHGERSGRRDGRRRGGSGGPACARSRARDGAGHISSNAAPTDSAPTRCSMPSSIASKDEIEPWRAMGPIVRFQGWLRNRLACIHVVTRTRSRRRRKPKIGCRGRLCRGRDVWNRSRN